MLVFRTRYSFYQFVVFSESIKSRPKSRFLSLMSPFLPYILLYDWVTEVTGGGIILFFAEVSVIWYLKRRPVFVMLSSIDPFHKCSWL